MNRYFAEDRKILILEQLQRKNRIPLSEMAEKLNVSARTIRNDIKLLNEILEDTAFIEIEQGESCLYIADNYGLEEKKKILEQLQKDFDSPQKRMAYIMKTLISSDKPYAMDELAYDMNIGRTTLSVEVKRLNNLLKGYSLSVIGMPNAGIVWKGEELNLRFFVLEQIYDFIYKDSDLEKKIYNIVQKVFSDYRLEYSTEKNFLHCAVITVDRILSGHSLKNMEEKFVALKKNMAWRITCEISKKIEIILKQEISDMDKLFMTIPLAGMRTPTDIEAISEMSIDENIESIINEIIEKIKYELDLYIKKENLQQDFLYHISFMINRLLFGYVLKNPMTEDIKKKYPLAYKMAKIAAKVIEDIYNVKVPEDELGYITAYFGAYILEYSINNTDLCHIALICSTGRGTAKLISTQLKRILNNDAIMDLFSEKQVTEELLERYDIIFTTVNLPFSTKKPILKIKDIFDEKELLLHMQRMKYLEKIDLIGTSTGGLSLIAALLEEDKFFLLNEKKSYLENTRIMIKYLIEKEYVDNNFWERIKEREENSTMIFGSGIAFPHTINKKENGKLVFALGVSSKKLADEKEVKLIFLLALPESKELDDSVLVRIYDEMISIAQNEDYIESIVKSKDYKQLVRCFIKLGIGNLM